LDRPQPAPSPPRAHRGRVSPNASRRPPRRGGGLHHLVDRVETRLSRRHTEREPVGGSDEHRIDTVEARCRPPITPVTLNWAMHSTWSLPNEVSAWPAAPLPARLSTEPDSPGWEANRLVTASARPPIQLREMPWDPASIPVNRRCPVSGTGTRAHPPAPPIDQHASRGYARLEVDDHEVEPATHISWARRRIFTSNRSQRHIPVGSRSGGLRRNFRRPVSTQPLRGEVTGRRKRSAGCAVPTASLVCTVGWITATEAGDPACSSSP